MIREFTCKKCGKHWEIWRQLASQVPKRPTCPRCKSRSTKAEIVGNLPKAVHFKGPGWTPKSGLVKDLRDVKGISPELAKELD